MRLEGRVAVITGGASGFGKATVERFLTEGARVAVADRDAAGVAELTTEHPEVLGIVADVSDERACRAGVAMAIERFDPIDTLVTCAGYSIIKTLVDTSLEEWNAVFQTNVVGTFVWVREVLRQMPDGGSIVTLSSQLAIAGGTTNTAYISSKGAILSLARSTALDVADRRIRVNVVLPGAIETPAFQRNLARRADPVASRAEFVARHPLGRVGQAKEVADAILYLSSNEASFTTGVALPVDGGWLAA